MDSLVALLQQSQHTRDEASPQESQYVLKYLEQYGYLPYKLDTRSVTLETIADAIADFQRWFDLDIDGFAGPETIRTMLQPRCGFPDILRPDNPDHQKLIEAQSDVQKWTKRSLTYYIKDYLPRMNRAEQDKLTAEAFASWTQHGNIDIRVAQPGEKPDIVIMTSESKRSAFDGAGGTLAMAQLPNGDDRQLRVWFDVAERWQVQTMYLNTAAHEFGHSWGLSHSNKKGALMAPYYSAKVWSPQQDDDIPRFIYRYNRRTTPAPQPLPGVPQGGVFNVRCSNLQVDGYTLVPNAR